MNQNLETIPKNIENNANLTHNSVSASIDYINMGTMQSQIRWFRRVVRRCSTKWVFLKLHKLHRKILESLFNKVAEHLRVSTSELIWSTMDNDLYFLNFVIKYQNKIMTQIFIFRIMKRQNTFHIKQKF